MVIAPTNSKHPCIVSPDFFKQFCHSSNFIVLGRDMKTKGKERLRDEHLIMLRDFLSHNLIITSINLSYNKITSEGLKTVAHILAKNSHIKGLILSNNNIDGEGIKYLAEVKSEIHLECLRMNGNKFKENTEEYIIEFLSNNQKLKYLDLGETDLTNDMLGKIAPAIIKSNLQGLVISSIIGFNSKTEDTALMVRHITAKNSSLTMLYLRKLHLMDSDVDLITTGLQSCSGLKLLDLSCNNISDIGGGFIVKYVVKSRKLQGLFLSHNRVADGTAYSLSCVVLGSNITMLDVSYNAISDYGLLYLLDLLQPTTGLRVLLWGNSIGPQCRAKLKTLHELVKAFPDKIDVAVEVDSNEAAFDHNTDLDMFKVNYYSLNRQAIQGRKIGEASSYAFPFHKISLK